MKRILLTTVAALIIAGPMALPASAQQGNYHNDDHGRGDDHRDNDRHDNDRHDNGRRDNDRNWDQSRHNGYYVGKSWHAGPPPVTIIERRDYRPAYKVWTRGDHLGYWNDRYVVVDYRAHHLRRPPHGYHWVQDDRGDFILAAIAGGLIASVILGATH